MKKSILIPLITVSILVIVAGTSVGVWYAMTPSDNIELSVESVSADPENDTVSVELTCENNETGQTQRHRRGKQFAYMHQIQIKNATNGEELYQEQYQWRWRHRIQAGNSYTYQYQIEGLEQGQMLQLRIVYNNGEVVTQNFTV